MAQVFVREDVAFPREADSFLDRKMTNRRRSYARAGVDVDLGNRLKRRIQSLVSQTHGPQVLGRVGGFGGLFAPNVSRMGEPVLVAGLDRFRRRVKMACEMNTPEP